MKKYLIALVLFLPVVVLAVNVSVPAAPGANYLLISNSFGTYNPTTTPTIGYLTATSTATSSFAGAISMANGSVGAPSLYRTNSPVNKPSGLYWEGTTVSRLYMVIDGAAYWRWSGKILEALGDTSIIQAGAGTALLPSLANTSDTDSGIFFTTTDAGTAFSSGGLEKMRINASGLGLGTTSPSNRLEVNGNGYFAGNLTATGTLTVSGKTTLANASTTEVTVANKLTVLGNASTSALKVEGNITVGTAGGGDKSISIYSAGGAGAVIGSMYTGPYSFYITSNQYFAFIAPYDYEMRSGGVFYWMDYDASSAIRMTLNSATGDVNMGGQLSVGTTSIRTARLDVWGANNSAVDLLRLTSVSRGNGTQRMAVTSAGNVGIGTSTPSNALEVSGSGYFTGNLWGANITATGTLTIRGASTLQSTLNVSSTSTLASTTATYLIVDDGSTTGTTTVAIGNPKIGKTCQWNGTNWTLTWFANNSITPIYSTSTSCQ